MRTAIFKVWIEIPEMPDSEEDYEAYDKAWNNWSKTIHAALESIPGFVEDEYVDWYE
jgi:hypothetical protein